MILIEINRICIENASKKLMFSVDMETVGLLRNNNRLTLALTLTNELKNIL